MGPLVALLGIVLAALAVLALLFGMERWLRQPGLTFLIVAVLLVIVSAVNFRDGERLLPALFLIQVPMFLYGAHARRTEVRAKRDATPSAGARVTQRR